MTTQLVPRVRGAAPRELTWRPTDGLLKDHYWVHMPEPKGVVTASVTDNVVEVEADGPLTVYLDERLVDFSKPVSLGRGEARRTVTLSPDLELLCTTLEQRGDPGLAFSARVNL